MPFDKLSRDAIVEEAIALMHEQGLDAVTLRAVAARLDARAPSLYRHIPDKRTLYSLMSQRIFAGCLASMPEVDDWRDWLRAFGHALWRAQSGDAGVLQLIQARVHEDSVAKAGRERITDRLAQLGMDRDRAGVAQRSVQALVTGWTTLRRQSDPSGGEADLFVALDALVAGWDKD